MIAGTLFAQDFLQTGITETADWRSLPGPEVEAVAARMCTALLNPVGTTGYNEANTEDNVIFPVLDALGWSDRRLAQERMEGRGRQNVPDAQLYLDTETRNAAAREPRPEARIALAAVVVENKAWQLSLDQAAGREVTPSAQLQTYLNRAYFGSDRKVRYGLLTNGRLWRLYDYEAKSLSTDYFEVDLAALLGLAESGLPLFTAPEADRPHWLKVFVLLFRRQAFETAERGRTFQAEARERGKDWEESVRKGIADVVFETVFPGLLRGLKTADPEAPEPPTPTYLAELREAVFTLLYRLLFALYAEDRGLIPTADRRVDDYSFRKRVRDDIERRLTDGDRFSTKRTDLYDIAQSVFETIDEGDRSVGVPPFNGGLFARERSPLLRRARLPDAVFAPLVDRLSRREGKRVNYRDLSVRELGSVYERLLVYEPVPDPEKEAGIGVRLSVFARKGSGSYYTPDELVRLIIDRTVGPLADEALEAFRTRAAELARTGDRAEILREDLAKADPAAAILRLRICDPAMGSGHFLVDLIDFLTARVFAATVAAVEIAAEHGIEGYRSPVLKTAEDTRDRIAALGREQGWRLRDEHLTDEAILRRMALKRCVYGVDKNPMAVELAKVALWLHTLTAGAPLSFLDHHLRCGDSLFGERVRPVLDTLEKRGTLYSANITTRLVRAAREMAVIEELTDADIGEAERSQSLYRDVEKQTDPLRRFLDFWHATKWLSLSPDEERARNALLDGTFGEPFEVGSGLHPPIPPAHADKSTLTLFEAAADDATRDWVDEEQLTLLAGGGGGTIRDYIALRRLIAAARKLAAEERFFHWQVAFPGVWSNVASTEPTGGFDAVIGNPPWDRMKMQEVEWFAARAPAIARQPRAADRKRLIAELGRAGDPLHADYQLAAGRAETAMTLARRSGEYPLLSRGDINVYSLFAERAQALIKPTGIAGLLTPSGIASDLTASAFFKSVAKAGRVLCLYDFENRRGAGPNGVRRAEFFPDVDSRFKFCAFVAGGRDRRADVADCAFFLADPPDAAPDDKRFRLAAADFALVNPNTGTAPIFRTRRDADLTTTIYRRLPVLVDRSGGEEVRAWPVRYLRMFDMTNDSGLFWTRARLEAEGAYPAPLGRWRKAEREWLPLYVGRMVHQFNHRAASVTVSDENVFNAAASEDIEDADLKDPRFFPTPQYWINLAETDAPASGWAFGFRDIARSTDERTAIGTVIPSRSAGNTLPICLGLTAGDAPLYAANFCSFMLDFLARQKAQSTHLNWYIVEQLPVIPAGAYARRIGHLTAADLVRDHVLRLTYTAYDMEPFARDMGNDGPPFIWDEAERRHLRARLDALYFILYGITAEDDIRYILSTFPIVERKDREAHSAYLTAELIVHYKRMLEAGDLDAPFAATADPESRTVARLDAERRRAGELESRLVRQAESRRQAT